MKKISCWRSLHVLVALAFALLAGCDVPVASNDRGGSSEPADGAPPDSAPIDAAPAGAQDAVADAGGASSSTSHAAANPAAAASEPFAAKAAGPVDISFDDVQFAMDREKETFQRSMLGDKIEGLLGRKILIRGYILPSFQQTGITQFVLVRDNQACCFGPNAAALYDCMIVEMEAGKSADYTVRPVTVEGTFTYRELLGPDGKHLAIYHVDGEGVR